MPSMSWSFLRAELDILKAEDAINMPSSIRPVEEKIMLSAINMGINLGDANLNRFSGQPPLVGFQS